MKKLTAIGLAVAMVAVTATWILLKKKAEPISDLTSPKQELKQRNGDISNANIALVKNKPQTDDLDLSDDPYANEAIRAQLLQVADLYAQTAQYPHTSQPIRDPQTARELEPFKETEIDTPFPVDGLDEPIRLQAAVDRYQYFQGDVINVRLKVAGAPPDTFVSARAMMSGVQGGPELPATMNPSDDSLTQFIGNFDTKLAPPGSLKTEMLLKLKVEVGDETLFATVPFRYSEASAQLAGIQYARPEAENLVVALQYSVFQAGYYFVSAILEEAQTGRPLVRLQGENRLAQGNGVVPLRAHISALRSMGSQGPYVLRSVKTYRGSEPGENYDVPASSVQNRYSVPGFSFDQYEDVPHEDADAQERIDFLENLAGEDKPSEPELPREEQ